MKKLLLLLLVLLISIVSVSADLIASDVRLGSSSQRRGENVSTSITVTNNGPTTITNLAVSFPGVSSKYELSGTFSDTSIAPNTSITLTVIGAIPLDLNAVDDNGNKISFNVGSMQISGKYADSTTATKSVNVFMQAEDRLKFGSGSQITIQGNTKSLRTDKEYTDIRRGNDIRLSVEVQNNFGTSGDCVNDGTNCNIDNVEANVQSDDSDLGVDEVLDYNLINANRKRSDTLDFTIPDDLSDGSYDIVIWVTGTDENGALHGDRMVITLSVNVPNDEISLTSYNLNPSTIACGENHATLSMTLTNTGTDDQSSASLIVVSSKLFISDSIYDITLDSSDQITKTFDLTLPTNLTGGQYFITMVANANVNQETDRQVATLTVQPCYNQQNQQQPVNNEQQNESQTNIIEVPPTDGVIYSKPVTQSINSTDLVLILGGMAVIALLLLVLIIVLVARRK